MLRRYRMPPRLTREIVESSRGGSETKICRPESVAIPRLKLEVNLEKSQVVPTDQLSFLGFSFRGAKISWSAKTLAHLQREVKRLTNRNWGVSMDRRLKELAQYLRGWMAYFWISKYYRPIPEIDQWIRRRIRMCYWVQWRRR